ncbi:MAG TPA: type VI secretion system-associated protein TagF [Burkholderiaceae bacterium]|nr:type VI secretion system-associated protein TagF [Burkholderiaceae bacterium]
MSETLVSAGCAPGWFGKLPNAGDFASRRLPEHFIRPWDAWLQRGLANSREVLGAAWLDGYLVAPIVRFWLGPGVFDGGAWAGLLMPSVDRVGRHFPLTIATSCGSLACTLAAKPWFDALDAVARSMLDVDRTIEDFEEALAQVAALPGLDAVDDAPAEHVTHELLRLLPEGGPHTVWWCADAPGPEHARSFEALPPESAFASVLRPSATQERV